MHTAATACRIAAVKWVLLGCLAAEGIALAGCAVIGGFDLAGYTAAPDVNGLADTGPTEDGAVDGYATTGDATPGLDVGPEAGPAGDEDSSGAAAVDANDPGSDGSVASPADGALEGSLDSTTGPEMDATDAPAADGTTGPDADAASGCAMSASSCGACGHTCQGGACVAGQCQAVTLANAQSPLGLAVTDSTVFWVEGGNIRSLATTGGSPSVYMASNANLYGSIVLDSTNAYWAADSHVDTGFLGGPGGSWSFDYLSSPIETLTTLAVDNLTPSAVWISRPANLYVVRHLRTTQGGGCATASIDIVPLMKSATVTSWTAGVCNVVGLAVDVGALYWTDAGTGNSFTHPAVWRHGILGGTTEPLAAAQAPYGIGVYGGKVYWTDANAGVMQYDLQAATSATQLAKATAPRDMAVDSTGVYWIEDQYGLSTIKTVPLAGGAPRTLAAGQVGALAIATNANSVFWLRQGSPDQSFANGAVMKVAK